MGRIETKALVESAIFAAVTALLGIIYYYTQYLGIVALVWPVPVIIVGYRNGLKSSILSALSAALIVSLITHPLVGIGLFAGFGLPGILMGYLLKRRSNPYLIVFLCGIVLALTSIAELVLSLMAAGINITALFGNLEVTFKEQMGTVINVYRQLGVSEDKIKLLQDFSGSFIKLTKLILPSTLLLGGMISSLVDFKLARLVLKRIGYEIKDIEKFMLWRIPEPYSIILLITAIISGAMSYFKIPGLEAVSINISTLIMFIFTVLGISVIVYFAKVYGNKYDVPKPVRTLVIVVAVLFFLQFIPLLGIVDATFNFRRLESDGTGGVR